MRSRSVNLINLINYKLPHLKFCEAHETLATEGRGTQHPTNFFAYRTNEELPSVEARGGYERSLSYSTQRKENLLKFLFNLRKSNPKSRTARTARTAGKDFLRFTACLAMLLTRVINFPKEKFTSFRPKVVLPSVVAPYCTPSRYVLLATWKNRRFHQAKRSFIKSSFSFARSDFASKLLSQAVGLRAKLVDRRLAQVENGRRCYLQSERSKAKKNKIYLLCNLRSILLRAKLDRRLVPHTRLATSWVQSKDFLIFQDTKFASKARRYYLRSHYERSSSKRRTETEDSGSYRFHNYLRCGRPKLTFAFRDHYERSSSWVATAIFGSTATSGRKHPRSLTKDSIIPLENEAKLIKYFTTVCASLRMLRKTSFARSTAGLASFENYSNTKLTFDLADLRYARSQPKKYLLLSKTKRLGVLLPQVAKLVDGRLAPHRRLVPQRRSIRNPKKLENRSAAVQKTSDDYSKNLLIMFSGGQDSITLLVLLFGIQSQNLLKLNLLWNHHLWHKDSFFITRHVLKLSFLFKISTHNAIALAPVKTELGARQWRLKVSRRLSNFYKYQGIMQAHSGTDKIETLLLNLFRGTSNTSPFHSTDFSFIFPQAQKRKLYFN